MQGHLISSLGSREKEVKWLGMFDSTRPLMVASNGSPEPYNNPTHFAPETVGKRSSHDALESVLEPLDRLLGVDLVAGANRALASSALGDTFTGAGPVVVVRPRLCRGRYLPG
jgi:hypothetical protein